MLTYADAMRGGMYGTKVCAKRVWCMVCMKVCMKQVCMKQVCMKVCMKRGWTESLARASAITN